MFLVGEGEGGGLNHTRIAPRQMSDNFLELFIRSLPNDPTLVKGKSLLVEIDPVTINFMMHFSGGVVAFLTISNTDDDVNYRCTHLRLFVGTASSGRLITNQICVEWTSVSLFRVPTVLLSVYITQSYPIIVTCLCSWDVSLASDLVRPEENIARYGRKFGGWPDAADNVFVCPPHGGSKQLGAPSGKLVAAAE